MKKCDDCKFWTPNILVGYCEESHDFVECDDCCDLHVLGKGLGHEIRYPNTDREEEWVRIK